VNLDSYVGNDPVNMIDPSGMCTGSLISNDDGTCKGAGGVNPTLAGSGFVDGPVPSKQSASHSHTSRPISLPSSGGRGIGIGHVGGDTDVENNLMMRFLIVA